MESPAEQEPPESTPREWFPAEPLRTTRPDRIVLSCLAIIAAVILGLAMWFAQ